jgi:hypothetical protein
MLAMKTFVSTVRKTTCLAAGLIFAAATVAQGYKIDFFTFDSAAGTSTGDGYSLTGGISQEGAAQISGEGYTLNGGFSPVPITGTPPLESVTIFDNTEGSANGGFGVTATTWLASRFCLGSKAYDLDSVSLLLNSQDFSGAAGPPSSVRLQIYSNDPVSGKPSVSVGVIMNLSSLTNPITPPRGHGLVKWTPATPFALSSNTCYWAVLSRESGGNIGQIGSFTMPTGDAGTFGTSSSSDAGATWGSPGDSSNNKMLILGTASETTPGLAITSVEKIGSDLKLSFTSAAGKEYVIQSRDGLSSGTWIDSPGAPTAGTGSPVDVTLPNAFARSSQFYRVKIIQ